MDTSNLWSLLWGGFLRHGLTTLGGGLVTAGYLSNDDLTTLVGAVGILGGIGWSLVNKYLLNKKA